MWSDDKKKKLQQLNKMPSTILGTDNSGKFIGLKSNQTPQTEQVFHYKYDMHIFNFNYSKIVI